MRGCKHVHICNTRAFARTWMFTYARGRGVNMLSIPAASSLWEMQQQTANCDVSATRWSLWHLPGWQWPGREGSTHIRALTGQRWQSLWQRFMSSLRVCQGFHTAIRFLFNMCFGRFEEGIQFQNCLDMFNDKYDAVWKHVTPSDRCLYATYW